MVAQTLPSSHSMYLHTWLPTKEDVTPSTSISVVSKIGNFDSCGSDPRRIQYAGSETDGLSVDYKVKYAEQLQVIKDNYATFAVPYNGEDNNDYVDGKGFYGNAVIIGEREDIASAAVCIPEYVSENGLSSGNVRFGASDVAITACVKLTFSAWVNKHDGTLAAVIGKLLAWNEVVTEFCKATNIADASCTQSI